MSDTVENISQEEVVIAPVEVNETEQEARTLGWKAQDEYKGEGWKPAEEYVAAKKTTLTTEVRALRNSLGQQQKAVEAVLAMQARKEEADRKAGYEQAMREINSRMTQAVKSGDAGAVNELATARDNLVRYDETQKLQQQQVAQQDPPEVAAWKADNEWFSKDEDMADFAKQHEAKLTRQGIPLQTRLEMTAKKVKEVFPYKFDQQRRTQSTTMATGNKTVGGGARPAAGTYEALTPEFKKECDKAFSAMGGKFKVEDFRNNYVRYAKPEMFQN